MKRGFESSFLHVFSKDAGTPSAPAAEEALSSAHASSMSFCEKFISVKDGPSGTDRILLKVFSSI
jgi:hypothetical protein